ncbi:nuclear GTPase SLIP-GC-like [Conger conger]|uniref:nuclear GTPase SLIP-GC-like n=1 Tax=Conger conger TaxID=82655 RepID=UPI002A59E6AD|nr:nuclear GTPase SLIP-GC-like [Conger conger]
MKNNRQSVFSYETEELLSTREDAFQVGKDAISQVYDKLKGVSCRENSFLEDLKEKISSLKDYNHKEKIYIGFFGKTGAGKSSLINAIVEESQLLPSGSMRACTSVFVHVQANTESSKYKADIEFISAEDWKSELHFLQESLKKKNMPAKDCEIANMAREKITAIYGEEGLKKDCTELVGASEVLEILSTGRKTLTFDTAKELSKSIGCYIRSDKKSVKKSVRESDKKSDKKSDTNEGKQFWPLVKQVIISLPKSPALLEGIVLVDLPGAGDVSKYRSDMWKECLSQCSSVWIVSEMKRALSEKVADEIFDTSLRTIAGGGECHNITFICTHTDVIDPENFRENHDITDEDLNINKDTLEYKKKEKQACILYRNDQFKEEIRELFKDKTKKFLLGDEDHSNEVFDVYTVSSEEFKKIAQGNSPVLDRNETELPALMEHIKKLYVSHFEKKVKDYVSDVSGVISYLHFSKDALSSKNQSSNSQEFSRLKKDLDNMCRRLNSTLSKVHTTLQEKLKMGAKGAEITCLENATASVLEPKWCDNRGHHMTLKAMCRNDGYYQSRVLVDLNYTLSEPMYKKMNEMFLTTFGPGPTRASIKGTFESFEKNFITNDLLTEQKKKKKEEKYLRLVYIRTEQRKVHRNLEKEILQRKKLIYNSLSDSIRDTMKQTYQECSDIKGKKCLRKIQGKLKSAIEDFKKTMFHNSKTKMLKEFSDLQKFLVDQIKTQMTNALTLGLNQIPEDLTGFPDVSEETAMMERCCESLDLQVF